MRKWWTSKESIWGDALALLAMGTISFFLKPPIVGIPIAVVILILGILPQL